MGLNSKGNPQNSQENWQSLIEAVPSLNNWSERLRPKRKIDESVMKKCKPGILGFGLIQH